MYLFDTNICIALLKDKDLTLRNRLQKSNPEEFALCSIVKAELLYGARHSQQIDHNLRKLEDFFAPFISLGFDDAAAQHYGIIRSILAKTGQPIGSNDLLIASIALVNDATLITRNHREFARVPGLRWEEW